MDRVEKGIDIFTKVAAVRLLFSAVIDIGIHIALIYLLLFSGMDLGDKKNLILGGIIFVLGLVLDKLVLVETRAMTASSDLIKSYRGDAAMIVSNAKRFLAAYSLVSLGKIVIYLILQVMMKNKLYNYMNISVPNMIIYVVYAISAIMAILIAYIFISMKRVD